MAARMRLRPGEPARSGVAALIVARLPAPAGPGGAQSSGWTTTPCWWATSVAGPSYAVEGVATRRGRARVELPRTPENPDGMALAPDGSPIVLENAIRSGAGRYVARSAEPLGRRRAARHRT
ncbi:hypothetical protein P4133_05095 [Pseudomonas aeruginosa]|nr:hypothetical protein [Pseudomonas aeruginosa]